MEKKLIRYKLMDCRSTAFANPLWGAFRLPFIKALMYLLYTSAGLLNTGKIAAQSVYHLRYNFHQPADSIAYQGFMIRYDDGSGLLRVRYTLPGTAADVLVECDVEEQPAAGNISPDNDTAALVLKAVNPRFIFGNSSIQFQPPLFLFSYNNASGFHEPRGVSTGTPVTGMAKRTSFAAALVPGNALTKAFVSGFFTADDEFFSSLFNNSTKGLTAVEKNTKLYLLVVADTLDKEIGPACSLDITRTLQTFKGIADTLGIKFVPKVITGASYSKKNVELGIANLKPAPADIIVFYYSGHGFRKQEEAGKRFPNIKLKTNHTTTQDVYLNSLNIEDIFNTIKKKPARFNLVLSDCCNNDIESTNSTGSKPGQTKGSGVEWSLDNCRKLFLDPARMSVLATAADNGQRACSKNSFGSFFSFYLATSLENYCSRLKTNVSWDQVLQDTKTQTINKAKRTYCDKPYVPENICNQYPNYKIVVGN